MISTSTWQPAPSECPICYETYADPRILPSCGHSLCRNCVDGVTAIRASQRFVVCPECRTESEVIGGALPKNHRFAAMIAKQRDPYRWASAPPDPERRRNAKQRVQPVPVIPTVDSANAFASDSTNNIHGVKVELGVDALSTLAVLSHTDRRRRIRPQQTNPADCTVCCKRFTDPRVLPGCGHSVCAACVKKLPSASAALTSVACPECSKESWIPARGFPKNYRLTDIIAEHDARSNRVSYQVPPQANASAPTEIELDRVVVEEEHSLPQAPATAPAQADIDSADDEDFHSDGEYVDVSDGVDADHALWNWEDTLNALRPLYEPAEYSAKTLLHANFVLAEYVATTFLCAIFISLATTAVYAPLYAWEAVVYSADNIGIPLFRFVKDAAVYFAVQVAYPLLRVALGLVIVVLSLPVLLALCVVFIVLECLKPALNAIGTLAYVMFRVVIAVCRLILCVVLLLSALALMNYMWEQFAWPWLLAALLVACLARSVYETMLSSSPEKRAPREKRRTCKNY